MRCQQRRCKPAETCKPIRAVQVTQQEQDELDKLLKGIKPKLDELKRLKIKAADARGDTCRGHCLTMLKTVRD